MNLSRLSSWISYCEIFADFCESEGGKQEARQLMVLARARNLKSKLGDHGRNLPRVRELERLEGVPCEYCRRKFPLRFDGKLNLRITLARNISSQLLTHDHVFSIHAHSHKKNSCQEKNWLHISSSIMSLQG